MSATIFRQLLNWLGDGAGPNGGEYLEMRRRLVSYFERKRCKSPDDLADETLNRVARRLHEEGWIESTPRARYCYIVARFVFLEHLREPETNPLDEDRSTSHRSAVAAFESHCDEVEERDRHERSLDCLDRCSGKLSRDDRELIFRYYQGEQKEKIENRQALAELLGVTANALNIRACRIRNKLEGCVRQCLQGTKDFGVFGIRIEDRSKSE